MKSTKLHYVLSTKDIYFYLMNNDRYITFVTKESATNKLLLY